MEVKELFENIKQLYKVWKQERDLDGVITEALDIERFIASLMYEYAYEFIDDVDNLKVFVRGLYELAYIFDNDCLLERLERIYKKIDTLEEPQRTRRLLKLIQDMHVYFNIPMVNDDEYNKANPHVIELYRAISAARNI